MKIRARRLYEQGASPGRLLSVCVQVVLVALTWSIQAGEQERRVRKYCVLVTKEQGVDVQIPLSIGL